MTPDFSIKSNKTVGKRIASNAGLIIGAKAAGVILGLGTLKIASMVLDPVLFGTVIFLHAYMLFFGEVTTFKNWQSIIRFGSDDAENEDVEGFSRLIKFAAKLDMITVMFAYVMSVALMGLAIWFFSTYSDLKPADLDMDLLAKYVPLYCLVLLVRLIGTPYGVLRIFDRFGLIAIEALSLPILRFLGSVYVYLSGGGFEEFLIVWFVASAANYLLIVFFAVRELKKRNLLNPALQTKQGLRGTREGLWAFAIKANVDSSIASGFMHLPQILVTGVFGPAWAGVYKFAEEVMKLLTEGFKLLDQVIYPELAKFVSQGNPSKIWPVVKRASMWMLFVGTLSSIFIWFAGPPALAFIFGEEYRQSGALAAILVPGATLLGMVTPIYPIFYAANKPERAIYVRGFALLAYVTSFFILAQVIGNMAPAWAIVVGNLFAVMAALITARITLKKMVEA